MSNGCSDKISCTFSQVKVVGEVGEAHDLGPGPLRPHGLIVRAGRVAPVGELLGEVELPLSTRGAMDARTADDAMGLLVAKS